MPTTCKTAKLVSLRTLLVVKRKRHTALGVAHSWWRMFCLDARMVVPDSLACIVVYAVRIHLHVVKRREKTEAHFKPHRVSVVSLTFLTRATSQVHPNIHLGHHAVKLYVAVSVVAQGSPTLIDAQTRAESIRSRLERNPTHVRYAHGRTGWYSFPKVQYES